MCTYLAARIFLIVASLAFYFKPRRQNFVWELAWDRGPCSGDEVPAGVPGVPAASALGGGGPPY